uniref:Uncharacterized protein n=1 Tax=Rhizophora mucronata TaxID=61149 RepID=A0A2P2QSE8_RHIMU
MVEAEFLLPRSLKIKFYITLSKKM